MRKREKGLVSIIMPCFNSAITIEQAIRSVLNQDYTNWELLVVDDSSHDNSISIIESFLSDSRIKLTLLDKNKGVANARNTAISASLGEYISFLDADDIWASQKLSSQLSVLNSGICDCVHSSYYRFDKESIKFRECRLTVSYRDMRLHNFIGNLTGMYNAEKLGVFYQKKIGHEDYLMWLEIIHESKYSVGVLQPLAFYRMQQGSLSSNKLKSLKWSFGVLRQKYSALLSMYFFSRHLLYVISDFVKER